MKPRGAGALVRYRVRLGRPHEFAPAGARKIIFHGVNKSGSGAMSKVIGEAYAAAGRSAEFHSYYRGAADSEVEFRKMIEQIPGPGFFVGHYLYGSYALPRDEQVLVTQFRHPLPRAVSIYHWHRRKAEAAKERFPTLEDWTRRGDGRAHSQIAQFAAPFVEGRRSLLAGMSAGTMLDLARESIERDAMCIGIAEYFEESIFLFAHLCGLDSVLPWKRDERNKNRTMVWDLPQSSIDLINEVMRHDLELYQWAVQRFAAQLRSARIGGDIAVYKQVCEPQYKDRLTAAELPGDEGLRARLGRTLRRLSNRFQGSARQD